MPSFGEKLKQEREKRKITLEEISVSTKIGTRMLQALEEDKFNQLPGGIFNKGFVRAYSRFVGLDEDQTVAAYLQASGDAPPPPTEIESRGDATREEGVRERAENVKRLEAVSDAPPRQLPWGWFAALLLVVAIALSFWSHQRRERSQAPVQSSSTAVEAPGSGRGSSAISREVSTAASPSSSGKTAISHPPPGSAPQNTALPPASPGEFTVTIQIRQESWVSVTADGKTRFSELMAAGNERAIRGRKEIITRLGNAGGVDLLFNGKKLDTRGEFGQVKTVTFGPGGLLPNAPEPSPTP